MIIKDLQLTNFGKFNHKSMSLEPGLNIIYGENEAGKTTFHTFIRGMLFGLEKQRGKASSKDTYSKYEPWDNPSNYQGMMRIESNGVDYRIERNFNRQNKSFKVINEDLGRELTQDEIDKLFTGLDESCYYNTISISQLGSVTDKELENILKNYAANLGSTKSMEIDIKEAFTDLDAQKKKIATDNRIGEEYDVERCIYTVKEQLEVSEREQHAIIASIEQKKDSVLRLSSRKEELSALDKQRLEELARQNARKDKLYQDVMTYTSEVDKTNEILEKIKAHKAELTSQLMEKGIDGHETMEMLSEKVHTRSSMPVAFIILALAFVGTGVGLILGNLNFLTVTEFWIRPIGCFVGAFICTILAIIRYCFNTNLDILRE